MIVGTLRTGINHGADLLAGRLSTPIAWQILLTFAVPYAVATISSVAAIQGDRHDVPCE